MNRAEATERRAADAQAREDAQTIFDRPVLLEAGAGTGKTTALVNRVLAWAMGPGWEQAAAELDERARRAQLSGAQAQPPEPARLAAAVLDGIVAITFTDAAAAEMERRIGLGLAALAGGVVPVGLVMAGLPASNEARTARARALCDTLDRLRVSTIHAWCNRLLARYPFDAGLAARLQVDSEERLLPEIVAEVIEDWLRAIAAQPMDRAVARLAAEGLGPDRLQKQLIDLVQAQVPPSALDEDPCTPARVAALADSIRASAQALAALVAPLADARRARAVAALATALARLSGALGAPQVATGDFVRLRAVLDATLPEDVCGSSSPLARWARGRLGGKLEQAAITDPAALAGPATDLLHRLRLVARVNPELLEAARQVLRPLLGDVYARLRAAGIETYEALLADALALLRTHQDVCAQERLRIRQLLVDEFQDTDPIQCEIVRLLGADPTGTQRPGLFLVGDPKQSIYGWRRADLRAYDRFLASIEGAGGHRCRLTVNFRSAPAILAEADRSIAPVMQRREGIQAAYHPLLPATSREQTDAGPDLPTRGPAGEGARVEYWVDWRVDAAGALESEVRTLDAVRGEAAALAADLAHRARAGDPGFRLDQCVLLLRSMGDLDEYLQALRAAGVPFAVERDRSYYRRREIIDAAALVQCVLDPHDQLALVTLLRSPWVGVPDAALLPLWAAGLPAQAAALHDGTPERFEALSEMLNLVAAELPPQLPGLDRIAGWEQSAAAGLHHLAVLRASFVAEEPDVFLERLRGTFVLEAVEAARYLGAYRVANLDRFFRDLAKAMDEAGADPQAILAVLRGHISHETHSEEARPPAPVEHAVRIMTIHKSKGLEFDHVYLGQLHKQPPPHRSSRPEAMDGRYEYELFGVPTLGFDRVEARRLEVERAELARTLYVALTRARHRVVLMGPWPAAVDAARADGAATHRDLLQARAVAPPLPALAEAIAREGVTTSVRDAAGAAWRMTPVPPEEAAEPLPLPRAAAPPTAGEIAQQSLQLHRARAAATLRMARPYSGTVSHAGHDAGIESIRDEGFTQSAASAGRAESEEESMPVPRRPRTMPADPARQAAVAVGSAIHQLLEQLDLDVDPAADLARWESQLPELVALHLGPDARAARVAAPAAQALLRRIQAGALLRRLLTLRSGVIARELPVLLPPAEDAAGPVGFVAGQIDLLYSDPETGELVVADYKTDAVESASQLQERAEAYRPQAMAYTRALQQTLGLSAPPRAELWFLAADVIHTLTQAHEEQA